MSFKYSPERIEHIRQLRQSGMTFKAIGERVGETPAAICALFRRMKFAGRAGKYPVIRHAVVDKTDVPDYVWIERDRRRNEYRTITQELMGDPPPSQSALTLSDKKP